MSAEVTAITESAQALFCSMADYLGLVKAKETLNFTKYPTYTEFKKVNKKLLLDNFKYIRVSGVTFDVIDKFLSIESPDGKPNKNSLDWYKSSINIAIKLLEDLKSIDSDFAGIQKPNWQDIIYYRGDTAGSDNVMIDISKLFIAANKKDKLFGDINKWSTADIYFASDDAKKKIRQQLSDIQTTKTGFNFVNLNKLIEDLISTGDLIGVSLKKAPNAVGIYRVNFTPSENEKLLREIKFFKIDTTNPRDIQLYMGGSEAPPFMQIRHDPSSVSLSVSETPIFKAEIIGKTSRLGSLTSFGTANASGTGITDFWAKVDPASAAMLYSTFKTSTSNYNAQIAKLNSKYAKIIGNQAVTGAVLKTNLKNTFAKVKEITDSFKFRGNKFDFGKKFNIASLQTAIALKPKLYDVYKNDRIQLSQVYVVNPLKKEFSKFFSGSTTTAQQLKRNNVCLEWFKYASAMSPKSGKFIIAK